MSETDSRRNGDDAPPDSRPYDVVLFDLDRTLIEHDRCASAVFAEACADCDVEPFCGSETLSLAQRAVAAGTTDLDADSFDRRVFETAAAAAGVSIDAKEVAAAYHEVLDPRAVSLRPGAKTALHAADPYETALVTNGPERTHAAKLAAVGLRDRFDVTLFGSDVERVKPAAEPFERALAELDGTPERALKIGDSLETDVRGATEVGIDTAWISDGKPAPRTSVEPTYTLSSLADLPSVLR
ncbi:haloacid dehalogenase superfamily enzyme, subfamily IA [Halovivax ruber XH-70]|uniref:Haloacid dehalogenase superfamily enzyme, subfamily IA n=1 Tax=Halovivax ruber (strain DSM 18193 / JCM 13892 / XH-70) TaxID=797302 RepID=L0IG35_HALRX|nr:HAD family hydrolase [Halovivax ruber]AGB17724.1 haloacid dehalogenase superfamily enzyme, subfamily IA [Halovivax ruber XH-70]